MVHVKHSSGGVLYGTCSTQQWWCTVRFMLNTAVVVYVWYMLNTAVVVYVWYMLNTAVVVYCMVHVKHSSGGVL